MAWARTIVEKSRLARSRCGKFPARRWLQNVAARGSSCGMKAPVLLSALALALLVSSACGETVKDREAAVRKDRAAMESDARWIYNDVERGFTEAQKTGKPLLVVLRCVPCLACAGIDAGVLQQPELSPLL